jgi:hypothetical protein
MGTFCSKENVFLSACSLSPAVPQHRVEIEVGEVAVFGVEGSWHTADGAHERNKGLGHGDARSVGRCSGKQLRQELC